VLAGCGGGGGDPAGEPRVAWDGTPVLRASTTGARVLSGTLKNGSSRELRLEAPDVKVLQADGEAVRSTTAVFSSSFVRSVFPHNGVQPGSASDYPEAEQRRVGYLAVLDPGKTAPLTASWLEPRGAPPAKRIMVGSSSLPVPEAAVTGAGAPAQ
jgi:hypothetical protein